VLAQIRKLRTDEGGFTLIELLMVIVILGVLATIVVFAVGGITDKGDTAACKANLSTVATAEEAYYAENSSYATLAQLVPGFLHSVPNTVTVNPATGAVSGVDATGLSPKGPDCSSVTL
jgi:prepilin-type N-terminal cleavage/methylation domain-containing protein